ncbi:MAG: hypothetical protein IPP48_00465 [Chitinophagaceae bacterium]|nr:hypothetical protein [Chitinophagaceae bacterium]
MKYRGFKWTEISKCYIRTYKPIKEFAGWGFRAGRSGLGYTVYGNQGVQLEFTDGRKILIGTNKPDEIKEILTKINQLKQ